MVPTSFQRTVTKQNPAFFNYLKQKKVWGKGTLKGTRTTEDLSSESVGSVLYLCCLGKCHRDRELRSHAAELPNQ